MLSVYRETTVKLDNKHVLGVRNMNPTEFLKIVYPNKDLALKLKKTITADMYENHNFNNYLYVNY